MFYPRTVSGATFRTNWNFSQIEEFFTAESDRGEICHGFSHYDHEDCENLVPPGFGGGGHYGYVQYDELVWGHGSPLEVLLAEGEVIITTPTSSNCYHFRADGIHYYSGSIAGFGASVFFPPELQFMLTSVEEVTDELNSDLCGWDAPTGVEWRSVRNMEDIFDMLYNSMLKMDVLEFNHTAYSGAAFRNVKPNMPEELENRILFAVHYAPLEDDRRTVKQLLIDSGFLEEEPEQYLTIYCPGIG